MEFSKRYEAEVRIPKGVTGVRGLITALADDSPVLEVKGEKEEGGFLQNQLHTFSFGQFTRLGEGKFRVRGEVTISTGDRERIPIKGEFTLNGKGWIERDRGRDPPER